MKRYQVGNPNDLHKDDPWFDDVRKASAAADACHKASNDREPFAVWEDDDEFQILPYIVRLYAFGQEFVPA